jgi:nitrite reductase (NADH) large subunit
MRYIIIGSGIAGITAAKTIRQYEPDAQIRVYTHEMHPFGLYARKEMVRRFAEGATEQKDFLIDSAAELERQAITLMYQEVLRVFPHLKIVLEPRHVRRSYDKLLIASGATPRIVDVLGTHLIGVHQMRIYEDLSFIEGWMSELQNKGAVVVGGGILGIDMAYALSRRGVPTKLIVRENHLGLPLLPKEAGDLIADRLTTFGVEIIYNQTLEAYFSEDDRILDAVRLSDGRIIPTRMALCTVGVRPATDFLDETGLDMDETTGALVVNEHMQTNDPLIFAAGSCAMLNSEIVRNWSHAAEQGHVAALNMLGQSVAYAPAIIGDLDTQIADIPLAYFGKTVPVPEKTQVWTWRDNNDQFAQVLLEEQRIVGAVLIGGISSMAAELIERSRTINPTMPEDLETFIHISM